MTRDEWAAWSREFLQHIRVLLEHLTPTEPPEPPEPPPPPARDPSDLPALLTLREAAAYLRVSTRTLRRMESTGLLRTTRAAGGRVKVGRAEVERLIREGTRGRD